MGMYIPDKDEWDELNDNIEDLSEKVDKLLEHFKLNKEDDDQDEDEEESSEEDNSGSSDTFIEE